MKTLRIAHIACCLFLTTQLIGQEVKIRPNDTTTQHVMIEPIDNLHNTFLGWRAGRLNMDCCNTFIGSEAGSDNLTGLNNAFLGRRAGFKNFDGGQNTYLGAYSGETNLSGSGNVFLGYTAGYYELGSNKLYIDNYFGGPNNSLIYGEFDNELLRLNAQTEVNSNSTALPSLYAYKNYTSGENSNVAAIHGENTVDYGYGTGVYGKGYNKGVHGEANAVGGINDGIGVVGEVSSVTNNGEGKGVYGWAYNVETAYGVEGSANGSGVSAGVIGRGDGPSTNYGVFGLTSQGIKNYGVRGSAIGSNENYGIYGSASGGSINFAGYFSGDVYVSQKLGVGTSTPKQMIHNTGDYYGKGHIYLHANEGDGQSGSAYIQARDDSGTSSIDLRLRNQENGSIRDVMTFLSNGKVGINTSNPSKSFTVYHATDPMIYFQDQYSTTANWEIASNFGWLYFRNSQGTEAITISPDGNIGIGLSSTEPMASGYLLSVDGKVATEEVRVDLSQNWPDYVFESNYELMPLEELEKSINEKGHLPGIPSAKEVESSGILLGDMQTRMMEKIEELTLYVLDLNKKIKAQEEEIQSLKTQLK